MRNLLDETLPKGEFCFVEEIAGPIPIRVLGHLLGVPDKHLDRLVELGDRMLVPTDPDLTPPTTLTPEQSKYLPFGSEAGAELLELGRPLIQERKGHPCGDVLSILANAEISGCPVSQHDLDNNLALLVVAGNETTRQGMALGLLALMEHPDQMELLRSEPSLMPTAIDELIRYASPVWHFRRTARRTPSCAGSRSARASAWSCGSPPRTATPRCSPIRTASTSRASATCTPLSGAGDRTSASARISHGSRWRSCSSSCCRASPRSSSPGRRAPALQLHERPQAAARTGCREVGERGLLRW